nr:DUF983 domain-containing protein [Hyphomicrobium methylovorum]
MQWKRRGQVMMDSEPTLKTAMKRGAMCKCPNCGEGRLFRKFLKVVDNCEVCGEELYHHRADDLPAYINMSIVGHIVIGGMLWLEMAYHPPFWVHSVIWFPLTLILSLAMLQPIKGTIVGMQWKNGMHGFSTRRGLAKPSDVRAAPSTTRSAPLSAII